MIEKDIGLDDILTTMLEFGKVLEIESVMTKGWLGYEQKGIGIIKKMIEKNKEITRSFNKNKKRLFIGSFYSDTRKKYNAKIFSDKFKTSFVISREADLTEIIVYGSLHFRDPYMPVTDEIARNFGITFQNYSFSTEDYEITNTNLLRLGIQNILSAQDKYVKFIKRRYNI